MRSTRLSVLESVRAVRDGVQPHRHAPFARHDMRIPEQDFYALIRLGYPLLAKDPDEKRDAWERFSRSPFSAPYRVGRLHRGTVKNGLLLKD